MSDHDLKLQAVKLGLSPAELGEIVQTWGPTVLRLVTSALKEGFSLSFVQEVLNTIGPLFLQQAVSERRLSRLKATADAEGKLGPCGKVCEDNLDECHESNCPLKAQDVRRKTLPYRSGSSTLIVGEQVSDFGPKGPFGPFESLLLPIIVKLLKEQGPRIAQTLIDALVAWLEDSGNQKQFKAALNEALADQ